MRNAIALVLAVLATSAHATEPFAVLSGCRTTPTRIVLEATHPGLACWRIKQRSLQEQPVYASGDLVLNATVPDGCTGDLEPQQTRLALRLSPDVVLLAVSLHGPDGTVLAEGTAEIALDVQADCIVP